MMYIIYPPISVKNHDGIISKTVFRAPCHSGLQLRILPPVFLPEEEDEVLVDDSVEYYDEDDEYFDDDEYYDDEDDYYDEDDDEFDDEYDDEYDNDEIEDNFPDDTADIGKREKSSNKDNDNFEIDFIDL